MTPDFNETEYFNEILENYQPMAQVNILEARVKFPADKVWPSKLEGGKDYVSLKCELSNGTGDAISYANVGSPEQSLLASYKKGDTVQLAYNGKSYTVVGSGGEIKTAVQTLPPTPQVKPGIDIEKAQEYAKVYAAIFIKLSEKLPVTTPAEVVGTAASTVFIALTRN